MCIGCQWQCFKVMVGYRLCCGRGGGGGGVSGIVSLGCCYVQFGGNRQFYVLESLVLLLCRQLCILMGLLLLICFRCIVMCYLLVVVLGWLKIDLILLLVFVENMGLIGVLGGSFVSVGFLKLIMKVIVLLGLCLFGCLVVQLCEWCVCVIYVSVGFLLVFFCYSRWYLRLNG